MDVNPNARLDGNISSAGGGGRGGGIAIGGIGGVIVLVLALLFGVDPAGILGSNPADQGQPIDSSQCTTGADVAINRECRWKAYVTSIEDFWQGRLNGYTSAPTVTFTGQVTTGCGTASSQVGPFYCPADKTVYIDTAFADQLLQQLGAEGGDAAEAYILAHEYGHHVSDLTGQLATAQASGNQTGPTSASVRAELQADCYAGVWFHNVAAGNDPVLTGVTQDDINRVSDAAQAVGDDRIQQATQGYVQPESWTHGSAAMRHKWLATGFSSGDPSRCDTFSTNNLGQ